MAAGVIFVFALCVNKTYPHNVFAGGFLFCAEAALVGGIADWFAVTALFRKPLGFPYHTAILPRHRRDFIKASTNMIQNEFFSTKKLMSFITQLNLPTRLSGWLEAPETRAVLVTALVEQWKKTDKKFISDSAAKTLKSQIKSSLGPDEVIDAIIHWLKKDNHGRKLMSEVITPLRTMAEGENIRKAIEVLLESYAAKKTESFMGAFLGSLASSMNLVNLDEAAQLIQNQLVQFLSELEAHGSDTQEAVLEVLCARLEELKTNPQTANGFKLLMEGLMANFDATEETAIALDRWTMQKSSDRAIYALLDNELATWTEKLRQDKVLWNELNDFLHDLAARTALQARVMIEDIVHGVLGRMSDEEINHLVYSKVEPDLLWIRMNGSIVGAFIGLILYVLIQLGGYLV